MVVSASSAIAGRAFADARVRTGSFAVLFAVVAYVNVVGYRTSYPTLVDRISFARSFGANKTVELFYGAPHDLLTVGGYTAWRVGGIGSIIAGVWGLLAAVRALRTEEDSGRQELVLAGVVTRRGAYLAALAAIGIGAGILWVGMVLGLVLARLPLAGSAYLAVTTLSPILVLAGVGAVASQIAPTRQRAIGLSTGVLVVAVLLRVIADVSTSLGWLRWATPFGWSEQLRAFADPQPTILILPVLVGVVLLAAAKQISEQRDVGRGVIHERDSAPTRPRLLSSPTALALRSERASLAGWLIAIAVFALVVGVLSTSFTAANIPANLRQEIQKLGAASIITPAGALSFYFLLFVFMISLFAASQVAATRNEEAAQRLETLFALPVSRQRWLAGRLLLAAAGAAVLAGTAALAAWVGAASQHAGVPLLRLLEAGVNCLPTTLVFLSLAALVFAVAPRATSGFAYGLVTVGFLWDLFGALVRVPGWLLDVTPFRHIGFVPAQPFNVRAAVVMLLIATTATVASLVIFNRRDLAGT
jgi:ABC-2 type transport system permease protein